MKFKDPCEWNAATGTALQSGEDGHAEAEFVIGRRGQWRLCATCANLSRFKRFKKTKIKKDKSIIKT